jgi:intracellular sulfur oxidation DsrE/DsrF family protein
MSTRSDFLAASALTALAAGAVAAPAAAAEGVLLDEAAFAASIKTNAKHRQAIGSVRVNDGACLQFAVNSLNGFTTGWKEPAANVQLAVVLAGSAAMIGLDDAAWKSYRFSELLKRFTSEFTSADGSQANPWGHPSTTLPATADRSIPALLARGVHIVICNTALGEIANRIVTAGFGDGGDVFAMQARLRTHALPGSKIVPAGISALVVLQENGYAYYSAAL